MKKLFSDSRVSAVSDVAALCLSDACSDLCLPVACGEGYRSGLSGITVVLPSAGLERSRLSVNRAMVLWGFSKSFRTVFCLV